MTEATLVAKSDREKVAEAMFESLNAHSIFLADQSILSLYATGRMDGVVLQIGHGITQVVPSHKGNPVPNTSLSSNLAGQTLDQYMAKLLEEQGIAGLSNEVARDIKEKLGYVALSFDTEEQQWESVKKVYKLPDGKEVFVGRPRFACPEALFQPSFAGHPSAGVHSLLHESVSKVIAATGQDAATFYKNIVVAGGTSLFPGMVERLNKEVLALAPAGAPVKITAASGGASSFIGGSILSCLPTMASLWVTKQMYLESGPSIIHEKCV